MPCTLTFVQSQEIMKVRRLISLAPTKSIEPPPPKKTKLEKPIVLDEKSNNSDTDPQWLKFQGCLLTESDRVVVISNDLLNDRHMNYAQAYFIINFQRSKDYKILYFKQSNSRKKSVVASR